MVRRWGALFKLLDNDESGEAQTHGLNKVLFAGALCVGLLLPPPLVHAHGSLACCLLLVLVLSSPLVCWYMLSTRAVNPVEFVAGPCPLSLLCAKCELIYFAAYQAHA